METTLPSNTEIPATSTLDDIEYDAGTESDRYVNTNVGEDECESVHVSTWFTILAYVR